MALNQRKAEVATQEEFQRNVGILDGISSWHLWGSLLVILLLPAAIVLLSVPSLIPHERDAGLAVSGLLGAMWALSGFAMFHLRGRIAMLRKGLIGQMEGAAKTHVRAEKFYGLSIMDPLTGLYNRRFGETRLQEEIAQAGESTDPLLVLALDFDRFKQINDVHGHATGDLALKTFARRLQRAIRACDVPIRVGGDEFLLILPDCPPDKVPLIFSRMGSIVLKVNGKQVPVCYSYGMAQCEVGDTPENMIKRADERLYEAKAKRKAAAKAEEEKKAASEEPPDTQKPEEAGPERVRRSGRFSKKLNVLLMGDDLNGKSFLEETKTIELSRHGVAILSRYKLGSEQHVILRCMDTNKEAEARIVRVVDFESDIHTYGLAFVDPDANIWDVDFPPLNDSEKEATYSLFECSRCKGREMVDDNDAANAGDAMLERSCKRCGAATPWERIVKNTSDQPVDMADEVASA